MLDVDKSDPYHYHYILWQNNGTGQFASCWGMSGSLIFAFADWFIKFAGLAPGPFASLILRNNSTSMIQIDRPFSTLNDILCWSKHSLAINPKVQSRHEVLTKLIVQADVLIGVFRPSVLGRLGLGPDMFLSCKDEGKKGLNEKLIFTHIIGWVVGPVTHVLFACLGTEWNNS